MFKKLHMACITIQQQIMMVFLDVKEAKAGVTLLGNVIIEYIFL